MKDLKDDKGKKLGLTPTHVMVPTALQWTAREVLDPSVLAAGGTTPSQNILKGRLQIIVNPYLANNGADSKYYVMDLSRGTKPFIYQTRKEAEFVALDNATDQNNFMRKEIFYGVDARFAFGYGDWKLCTLAAGA
jgi:phage major head subunit gpT-like protein